MRRPGSLTHGRSDTVQFRGSSTDKSAIGAVPSRRGHVERDAARVLHRDAFREWRGGDENARRGRQSRRCQAEVCPRYSAAVAFRAWPGSCIAVIPRGNRRGCITCFWQREKCPRNYYRDEKTAIVRAAPS